MASDSARAPPDWLHRAAEALERDDPDEAERIAHERLATHPGDPRAENVLDDVAYARSTPAEGPAFGAPGLSDLRPGGRMPSVPPTAPHEGGPSTPPLGVVVLAALGAIQAIGLALLAFISLLAAFSGNGAGVLLALAYAAAAGITFLVARGLWRQQAWAWWLTLLGAGAAAVAASPGVGRGEPEAFSALVVAAALVVYLLLVRRAFTRSEDAEPPRSP